MGDVAAVIIRCVSCQEGKPATDFYRHPNGEHERMRRCKECHKAAMRANRRKNPLFGRVRWRGKLPIPRHAPPLVRRFVEILNEDDTTITEVAERAGIRRKTICDWRYRRQPTLGMFEAALNVLGYEMVIRKKRGDGL